MNTRIVAPGSFSNPGGPLLLSTKKSSSQRKQNGSLIGTAATTVAPSAILRKDRPDHISRNKLRVSELSENNCRYIGSNGDANSSVNGNNSSVFTFGSAGGGFSSIHGQQSVSATRSTLGHKTKREIASEYYATYAMAIQKQQKQRIENRALLHMGSALLRKQEEILAKEKQANFATIERLNAAIQLELQRKKNDVHRHRQAVEDEVRSAKVLEAERILRLERKNSLFTTLVNQSVNRRKSVVPTGAGNIATTAVHTPAAAVVTTDSGV